MTEKQLMQAITECARLLGWMVYHTFDSRRSEPGFPDLVLVFPGWALVFAELKSARGKVTEAQQRWLDDLASASDVETYVWRPADWLSGHIEAVLRRGNTTVPRQALPASQKVAG